jgi:hypothetical protein
MMSNDTKHMRAISTSPSDSPLTSDEEPFDHNAEPESSSKPSLLGLRELAALRKSRKKTAKATNDRPVEIKLFQADLAADEPVSNSDEGVIEGGLKTPLSATLPFARDVELKGWKIVGGKGWNGAGKVGAYVGEPRQTCVPPCAND